MELTTKNGIGSIFALLAVGISETTLSGWVSVICSLLIAITTCFVQIYRLWRDKDSDKQNKENKENESKIKVEEKDKNNDK